MVGTAFIVIGGALIALGVAVIAFRIAQRFRKPSPVPAAETDSADQ